MKREDSKPIIFISHRTTDKPIAEMLLDFFVETGIPRTNIFCSSLPGNDVNENIHNEIRQNLKSSVVNIAILSNDYFSSPYCLNEEGIFWFCDAPVILIALPEIIPSNLKGFLNSDIKLRRLDNNEDVSYIYDTVRNKLNISSEKEKVMVLTVEINKLVNRYKSYLESREIKRENPIIVSAMPSPFEITTDDERIVLYYTMKKNAFVVLKQSIDNWLFENEIFDVDVDNAFNTFSASNCGSYSEAKQSFTFDITSFRKFSKSNPKYLDDLRKCVDKHHQPRSQLFLRLWNAQDGIDSSLLLFLCYIIETRETVFEANSLERVQLKDIENWELHNSLESVLSNHYHGALQYFIDRKLVCPSEGSSIQDACYYRLYPSLRDLLLNCPKEIESKVLEEKAKYDIGF